MEASLQSSHVERCGRRLPKEVISGWTFSLLCDLRRGHSGDCEPDDLDILTEQVLPTMEEKYQEERNWMTDQARANEKRTLESVYGKQD